MDVIRHQKDQMSTRFESQSQFSFWVSKNRAVLALQAVSVFLFLSIFLALRLDFTALSSLNLGRTHMFILCNGIVAILVKGSVLADPHEDHQDGEAEQAKPKSDEVIISAAKSVESEKSDVGIVEEDEEKEDETVQIDQQLVQEEEEDGFEELSVEELNKKCDEFIRKMRGVISNGNVSL